MFQHVAVSIAFITLHQPNNLPVYVQTDQIEYVAPAIPGLSHHANAMVAMGSGKQLHVRESPEEVYDMLKAE